MGSFRPSTPMPDDPRQRAVGMIASVICAATGRDRVAVAQLVAGCRTVSALRGITAQEIGKLLACTAWKPAQWRENGGRVRGYVAPVTDEKANLAR